jgi:energy-coupling factor transporter ATP-binding protein EcfA2
VNIVSLTSENFKRLKAVRIEPNGTMVVVGGRNAQGKSSVLDSIAAALGGKDAVPDLALRQGAESGQIILDLGDIVVRRGFTEGGNTTLTVKNKDGATFSSPQAMLDKLVGKLSFDPLAFARMKPTDQLATLKQLVGLDFTAQDAARKKVYDERTAVGTLGKSAKARLDALPPVPADTPTTEVSVTDLMRDLESAEARNSRVDAWRRDAADLDRQRATVQQHISDLETQLANAKAKLDLIMGSINAHGAEPAKEATDDLRARIASAESINRNVRLAAQRQALADEIARATADWASKTKAIEAVDADKAKAIAAAPMPVPGLSLSDAGVLLNGVPFAQASSAEQLRVSVAMGLALNPKLRVVLIRDGSLLDADSMAIIAAEAAKHEAQLWVEKVSATKDGCTVLIEDGEVAP